MKEQQKNLEVHLWGRRGGQGVRSVRLVIILSEPPTTATPRPHFLIFQIIDPFLLSRTGFLHMRKVHKDETLFFWIQKAF